MAFSVIQTSQSFNEQSIIVLIFGNWRAYGVISLYFWIVLSLWFAFKAKHAFNSMLSINQSMQYALRKWTTITLVLLLTLNFQVISATIPQNQSHFTPQKRIVGGAEARWEYQRHIAYLELVTRRGHFFPCAGTVVGRRWILTTAHCIQPTQRISYNNLSASSVYIGSKSAYPQFTMDPYTIKSVYINKHWKPGSNDFRNDIALIMLRKLIDMRSYVPIEIGHAPPPKSVVTAVGYGSTSDRGGMPSKLMQANLVAQKFQTCASREPLPLRKFLRDKLQVCATSLGFPHRATTDTCCKSC